MNRQEIQLSDDCEDWAYLPQGKSKIRQMLLKPKYALQPTYVNEPKYLLRSDVKLAGKKKPDALALFDSLGIPMNADPHPNSLPVTHCSNTKVDNPGVMVYPWELYSSGRNIRFNDKCEELGLHYGVITSDYGMGVSWERSPSYHNEDPGKIPEEELWIAGGFIAHRCAELGIEHIHYVTSPPSVMVSTIIRLFASGVSFTVATNNKSLEQLDQHF